MRPFYAAVIVACGISFVGCFSPTIEEGIICSEEGTCPEGMSCDPIDNRCRYMPLPPTCGDGLVNEAGEECDERGETATCDIDCTLPACGDGRANLLAGEECDDGGESASCDADCTTAECGDGVVNAAAQEECDDVNGETIGCDDDCTLPMCGDGRVNMTFGEVCDGDGLGNGGETALCDADCTDAACGDGTINNAAGEDCDDVGETIDCDADCTVRVCGDGTLNVTAGEFCDDAGESAACDVDCTPAECGDGTTNATAGELCDGDGMGTGGETAACDIDCSPAECGDGVVNAAAGEQCDDGNTDNLDGCDSMCTYELLRSCAEILALNPTATDGFYNIDPDLLGPAPIMNVYCDMTYMGGGWTNLDFASGTVYLANGNTAVCTMGLTGNATSINCQFPHVNNDPGRWMYHFLCDGSDNSANYIIDHMSPLLGHQASLTIGGWISLSQQYISEASLNDEEYCYITGNDWVLYTDPACAAYNASGNGNCAINEFILGI